MGKYFTKSCTKCGNITFSLLFSSYLGLKIGSLQELM